MTTIFIYNKTSSAYNLFDLDGTFYITILGSRQYSIKLPYSATSLKTYNLVNSASVITPFNLGINGQLIPPIARTGAATLIMSPENNAFSMTTDPLIYNTLSINY
jgi:hypothetical protein